MEFKGDRGSTGVYLLDYGEPRPPYLLEKKRGIEPRLFHLGDADPGPATGTVEA